MPGLHRWLASCCVALLGAGAVGVATHRERVQAGPHRASATGKAATAATPVPTTTLGPVAGSAALAAGLLTPSDLGGSYRADPGAAASFVASTPCLAGLEPSPSQAGRADTALVGPGRPGLPAVVELAASYSGQEPETVYREVVSTVDACPAFGLTFGGASLSVPLKPLAIAPVGVADSAWSGTVPDAGTNLLVELAVVFEGHDVVSLLWVDTQPPAGAAGGFEAALGRAVGKLAGSGR